MVSDTIRPGRAALMAVNRKIELAQKGYTFLKMKRQKLLFDLDIQIEKLKDERRRLADLYQHAQRSADVASMMEGDIGVTLAAFSVEPCPRVEEEFRHSVGMKFPVYTPTRVVKTLEERGYGLLGTTSIIDDMADDFENVVLAVIQCAETERTLYELLAEIQRLRRRVNALEYRLIPDLIAYRDLIRLRMDELEREEFSRLFRYKKIRERNS
jgi:V/A-type H+-transporting ATPase subunit D